MTACFPKPDDVRSPAESIDSKARVVGYGADGDLRHHERIAGRVVIGARDGEDAAAIAKDFGEILERWKSHLKEEKDALEKAVANPKETRGKVLRAVLKSFVAAVESASVSRSGNVVSMSWDQSLESAETKELKEAYDDPPESETAVYEALAELIKGPKISDRVLDQLVKGADEGGGLGVP